MTTRNSPNTPAQDLSALAAHFKEFADQECGSYAPTYARFSRAIATAPDLLALAARTRPGQRIPNMFLAASQYLFGERLREMPAEEFLTACREHGDEITDLCAGRLVQTNEARRSCLLLPALTEATRRRNTPLWLIEVGASAGLLLIFDRYRYDYGWAGQAGDPDSPLLLECEVRGEIAPPLDFSSEKLAGRTGIDLSPIRTDDTDAIRWLRALIWPDHTDRLARLDAALALAGTHPVELHAGDALDLLPEIVESIPKGITPIIFHYATLIHFKKENQERFSQLVSDLAHARQDDLLWLQAESISTLRAGRPVTLTDFRNATKTDLEHVQAHGEWLHWLAPSP